jgi:UDP-glucose 6-dehydrogenase
MFGANIDDIKTAMAYDPRIGDQFLNAGVGYGGSCFPKDARALNWMAHNFEYDVKTISAAIEVNEIQRKINIIYQRSHKHITKIMEELNELLEKMDENFPPNKQ